jgi:hypothetical protein
VTESPDESADEALTVDQSQQPFPRNVFLVLVVVAVVLPPVGMLIGAFNMDKPSRRRQSQLLLGIGLVVIVLAVLATS